MKNYYDLLGVDKHASQKQINDAFKRLSLKFHPDKNGGDPYYVELFQVINEARQVLSDETKRLKYDYSLKKSFSGHGFYAVTEEFLQRKKHNAAKKLSKPAAKRVKWPLAVAGLGFVITLILIITDKSIEYFTRPAGEEAALNIKVLKKDSLSNNNIQVTDDTKKSSVPVTSHIAIPSDSAEKRFETINKPLKIPAETPLISNNKQKAAAEKISRAINKPLKLPAETPLSSNNKQKAVAEKTVLELVKPAKKENQVTRPSALSESLGGKKTVGAHSSKASTAADTKVINNVLLSPGQMTNILNRILSRKAESGNKINCVKILVTNGSNVINAFKVANFLRAYGLIIAGRETIKEKITGIKIAAYKDCINVTIGNL